jgi:hypothetical protein
MSIFVSDHHLLHDLLEILISYLNNTIHLGFVRRRFGVYNHPLGADKVVNSVPFRPEWPKHSVPIQKTEQNGTNFISF